jgi:hypothetical protein
MATPASGQVCVELPAGSTCPAPYTAANSGTYYSGYSLGTCACGCSPTSASCSGGNEEIQFFTDPSCGTFFAYNTGTTVGTCVEGLYFGQPIAFNSHTINSARGYFTGGTGTCSNSTSVTNASAPTGPSVICCK